MPASISSAYKSVGCRRRPNSSRSYSVNVRFCRGSSLHWPMADLGSAAHCGAMVALDAPFAQSRELGLAAVAHLLRYRGTSREHTESDLRVFFCWCQDRQLAPLGAQRHDLELYLRWMQDVRRFKPSTVSRRLSVVAGPYRTCVIDGVLEHSPADYGRPSRRSHQPLG
jgi:hypothetical protein